MPMARSHPHRSGASVVALAAALMAAEPAPAARANDSTASIDAGGLQLIANPNIEMQDELLRISLDRITVRYKFRNTSKDPIRSVVAFPLPEIDFAQDIGYSVESNDPLGFTGFEVAVNGAKVTPTVEVRATALGVDVTELMNRYGVPMLALTQDDAFEAKLEAIPPEARADLEAHGVIDWHSSWTMKDGKEVASPVTRWSAKVSYYWLQDFPPGETIEVTHSYRPVPESGFFSEDQLKDAGQRKQFCWDNAFKSFVQKRLPKAEYNLLSSKVVRYILTTGNNWRGGLIKSFKVEIDKGGADMAMAVCLAGLKPAGPEAPNAVTNSKLDFRPDAELKILYVQPLSDK